MRLYTFFFFGVIAGLPSTPAGASPALPPASVAAAEQQPLLTVTEEIDVADFDGDATMTASLRYVGSYGAWMRQRHGKNAGEVRAALLARYQTIYPGATLLAEPKLEGGAADGSYEVKARLKLPHAVTRDAGHYLIPYDSGIADGALAAPAGAIGAVLGAQRDFHGRYRLLLRWPVSVRTADGPVANTVDTRWYAAHEEFNLSGNVLDHLIDYRIKRDPGASIGTPQFEGLETYAGGLWRVGEDAVGPPAFAGFSLRDFWLAEDVDALPDGAAAAGKAADPAALCGMVLRASRVRLARQPLASDDLLSYPAALAAQPGSTRVRACRGQLAFNEGRFVDAVPLLGGSAQADPAGRDVQGLGSGDVVPWLLMRAWAHIETGNAALARTDVDRYLAARRATGGLTALDAAHAIAIHQRAGRAGAAGAIPAELLAFARLHADGPWPRPLLALQLGMLDGNGDEAAVWGRVAAMSPVARSIATEEMWFFLGQHRLAVGDREGALQAFRAVVDSGTLRGALTPLARAALGPGESADADVLAAHAAARQGNKTEALRRLQLAAARGVAAAQSELGMAALSGAGTAAGKPDPAEALRLAQLAEAGGNADGASLLGALYADGSALPRDMPRAVALYERAAAAGSSSAPRAIAKLTMDGAGGKPRDSVKALAWLHIAASRNDAEAQGILGNLYYLGYGGAPDYTQAWYWSRRAMERGHPAGALQMARQMLSGRGVPKDPAAAVRLLESVNDNSDSVTAILLARLYDMGLGTPKDGRRAYRIVEQAASAGGAVARTAQGVRLLRGMGVDADPARAIIELEQLAQDGESMASLSLAKVYFDGTGVPKDAVRAAGYLRQCAERGVAQCQQEYALALHYGRAAPRDFAGAAAWYRKAADQGLWMALNNLADLYENGQGMPQDLVTALRLYREAGQQQEAAAFVSLGALYEKGLGVPVEPHTAYALYRVADRLSAWHADEAFESEAGKRARRIGAGLDAPRRLAADAVADRWRPGMALPGETAAPAVR